ncbi:MAG: multidrug efflux SMR transporter [Pseudanabaena sp. ELA645]
MIGWIYLVLAIILELGGSTCMKLSNGFTKVLPSVFVFVFYGICYWLLALALDTIEMSIAYAVWAGLGTVAISIIGVVALKEPINFSKTVGIILIASGVVILELIS